MENEKILQQLAELHDTVKSYKTEADRATMNIDSLAEDLKGLMGEMDEIKQRTQDGIPDRQGDYIAPVEDVQKMNEKINHGKFAGQKVRDVYMAGVLLRKARRVDPDRGGKESPEMTKLLTSTGSGAGDEYVPTEMMNSLWQDIYLESKVVQNLGGFFRMPSDPYDWPAGWGGIDDGWKKATEGEGASATTPTTAKSQFQVTELILDIPWSYSFDEDSMVEIMPSLMADVKRSGSEKMDGFVLNADSTASATGNINLDDDTPPTDSYYLSSGQDGIRHYYLVDRTSQSADISTTLTDALWRAGIAKAGKYAARAEDMLAITNVKTYLVSLLGLTNVRTIDKYGQLATILTGEVARIDNIPIIPSASMPLAEDDGKVSATAGNNDEGQIAFPNRSMWKVGYIRDLMIEVAKDIRRRQFIMVASMRIAIGAQDNGDSTTRGKDHTAGIHGITYA